MQTEPRVTPAKKRAKHRFADAPFPEEHLEDPVAEEMLQDVAVDLGNATN